MASDILNADKLIAWLRTQPPEEEYIWSDPVFCLMGRYVTDRGTPADLYGYSDFPNYHEIAEVKPHTFGAALLRAEKLKALPAPISTSRNEVVAPEVPLVHDQRKLLTAQTNMPLDVVELAPRT